MANFSDFGEFLTDDAEVDQLKTILFDLAIDPIDRDAAGFDRDRIPIMCPSTLCRRDIASLRKKTHWVAEKSDGDRCLLLSLASAAYLVDMKFGFYKISRDRFYLPRRSDATKAQDKTLLDCVMVWNHAYEKFSLMVIDVYAVDGEDKRSKYFRTRIEAIREHIIVPVRSKYPSEVEAVKLNPDIPFVIQGKEYFNLDQLTTIFARINEFDEGGKRRFIYHFDKRYNENDGIIFVPDETLLKLSRGAEFKKWKWHGMNTVLFHFNIEVEMRDDGRPPKTSFKASLAGEKNRLQPYREVYFRKSDADRLIKDATEYHDYTTPTIPFSLPCTAIAECFYDVTQGEWTYFRHRGEAPPTPYYLALTQMEASAERVTRDELLTTLNLIKGKSRPSSNPSTPSTPLTPAFSQPVEKRHSNPNNEDTGESPSPTISNGSTGGIKRPVDDVYRNDRQSQPSNETKRQRIIPDAERPY